MKRPEFKPDVPLPLLHGATERDRWMYEQQSIQRQQNDWIISKLADGEERFRVADDARETLLREISNVSQRLMVIEKIKDRITARWTVVAFIAATILGPIGLAFLGAAFTRLWEKIWK